MWLFLFFFKQKTAYDMRISDWSSDVCSSDLVIDGRLISQSGVFCRAEKSWACGYLLQRLIQPSVDPQLSLLTTFRGNNNDSVRPLYAIQGLRSSVFQQRNGFNLIGCNIFQCFKIGRSSCRERVCQYVYISVVPVY